MKRRPHPLLDAERDADLKRAERLEVVTLVAMALITFAMGLVMGGSQAMRTAWVEDLLSLVPPAVFLFATRIEKRPPRRDFPFGFLNVSTVAFLCATVALCAFGLLLLLDAVVTLVTVDRPAIGGTVLFGRPVWSGWVMIVVVTLSVIPPLVLGRMKLPIARRLHDKTLHADADMNKADWLTGIATAVGVLGVGLGFWWADSAAAAAISISIMKDGFVNLRTAFWDLMDHRPTDVDGDELDLDDRAETEARSRPWVLDADLRSRQEGRFVLLEGHVAPRPGEGTPEQFAELTRAVRTLDWRLGTITLSPTPKQIQQVEDPESRNHTTEG